MWKRIYRTENTDGQPHKQSGNYRVKGFTISRVGRGGGKGMHTHWEYVGTAV